MRCLLVILESVMECRKNDIWKDRDTEAKEI